MEALKFTLSGKTAMFKKPDVNTYVYYTYNNIHKVAILGILGAIIGLSGYEKQMEQKKDFPEFYEKLRDLKISIVPREESGIFNKKIQTFNNSVGYASYEAGGNLIVKEQWLENPSWDIYMIIDDEQTKVIKDYIINKKCVYIPYLGKNDHIADISNAQTINIELEKSPKNMDSLAILEDIEFDFSYDEDIMLYKYMEYLPTTLNPTTNLYETKKFVKTNAKILSCKKDVYNCEGKCLYFF